MHQTNMKYTHYFLAVAAIAAVTASPVAAETVRDRAINARMDAAVTTGESRPLTPEMRRESKDERKDKREDRYENKKEKGDDKRETRGNPAMNIATATLKRINLTIEVMTAFGTKLEARINAAKANGVDVSAWTAIYTDYIATIASAKANATAAAEIAATATTMKDDREANKQIFTEVRTKIKLARTDLQEARALADKLVKAFRANAKSDVKAGTTATIETQ